MQCFSDPFLDYLAKCEPAQDGDTLYQELIASIDAEARMLEQEMLLTLRACQEKICQLERQRRFLVEGK